MKVESVTIFMKAEGKHCISATDGIRGFSDVHYIVRDGMATVNYQDDKGHRQGRSVPIADIDHVVTIL